MKRVKIKTEHAGAKNRGGWWGSRAEAKELSRMLRRRNDKALIEQEVIEMCSRDDDPTQHDEPVEDPYLTDLAAMLEEQGARIRADRIGSERRAALGGLRRIDTEAVLRADRDDPSIDYASEV
jgi:hypothetical protein